MENTGKEMSPLVVKSKCSNCAHNLKFTVNVPEVLMKKVQADKVKLTQTVLTQSVNVNALKKKVEDMERSKAEITTAMQSATNNNRMEMESLKKNTEGTMGEELAKVRRELEAANQTNNAKATKMFQLKKIARKFREQKDEAEKKGAALEEEKKKLEEELAKTASEGPSAARGAVSPIQGDDETHKLLEQSMKKIRTLETEMEKLKAENEELQKMSTLKGERANAKIVPKMALVHSMEEKIKMKVKPSACHHCDGCVRRKGCHDLVKWNNMQKLGGGVSVNNKAGKEEELAKKASEGPRAVGGAVSPIQGDDETHKLLEKIRTLETETEKLKAENEELQKMSTLKEERAKSVLKTARAKIQKCEDEKKKLEMEIGEPSSCKEY